MLPQHSAWIHVQQQDDPMQHAQESKYIRYVRSPTDINWNYPLKDQLRPRLKGGLTPGRSFKELRHFIHLREAAAWVINGTHWFSVLKQPMMIVTWCLNWEDASKFQYLMQILQVNLGDYIPRYQIFVEQEEEVNKLVQHWLKPSTLWQGHPVIGFMADSYLDDLETLGFKHFNPMWTFPTTSVYQSWDPMTFGMAP